MSILPWLNEVEVSPTQHQELLTHLYDVVSVGKYLQECEDLEDVIRLLKVALLAGNRPYFIPRIYGRYKKLLPKYDYETMYKWAETKGKCD